MKSRYLRYIASLSIICLWIYSCNKDNPPSDGTAQPPITTDVIVSQLVVLNPSGYAPLSAVIELETNEEVRVDLRIKGKSQSQADFEHQFSSYSSSFTVPVHGLYADYLNEVELNFFDRSGNDLGIQRYEIQTEPLIDVMPDIFIEEADRANMEEGMTLVSYFGHNGATFPQRPFMFDTHGEIRWYLDYNSHPSLGNLFYDDGIERLANGNFYFGFGGEPFGINSPNQIFEIDLFGEVVNTWNMPGYLFHHEVYEKPNGNFLVTVSKRGVSTVEDYIIEIDRNSDQIINEWDLNSSLQNTRTAWTDDTVDWIHVNAVTYDAFDDTIIISGRTQGVIKLTANNEVVWILSPHRGWANSGNGADLTTKLLTPLDSQGQPITDTDVLDGNTSHPDFEWSWYQHAPLVKPNGHIMIFDNGDNRNYTGSQTYSRAVEYRVDDDQKTIRQIWQYGKERGPETYSRIVSDVDYLPNSDHVLFSPGAITTPGSPNGKSIEIDVSSGNVVFEATIVPPSAFFNIITLHRTERLSLYP